MSDISSTVFADKNLTLPANFEIVATGTEDPEGLARRFDQYRYTGHDPLNGRGGSLEQLAFHLDVSEVATILIPIDKKLSDTFFRAYADTVRRCDLTFGSTHRNDIITPVSKTLAQPIPAPAS